MAKQKAAKKGAPAPKDHVGERRVKILNRCGATVTITINGEEPFDLPHNRDAAATFEGNVRFRVEAPNVEDDLIHVDKRAGDHELRVGVNTNGTHLTIRPRMLANYADWRSHDDL